MEHTAEEEIARLREELNVCREICGTFFEALKPLNLTHINVANPGSHVTELIRQLTVLKEWQRDVQEREAAVCPEDVGFDEYIGMLERENEHLCKQLVAATPPRVRQD
jgi:hypothetical protein